MDSPLRHILGRCWVGSAAGWQRLGHPHRPAQQVRLVAYQRRPACTAFHCWKAPLWYRCSMRRMEARVGLQILCNAAGGARFIPKVKP